MYYCAHLESHKYNLKAKSLLWMQIWVTRKIHMANFACFILTLLLLLRFHRDFHARFIVPFHCSGQHGVIQPTLSNKVEIVRQHSAMRWHGCGKKGSLWWLWLAESGVKWSIAIRPELTIVVPRAFLCHIGAILCKYPHACLVLCTLICTMLLRIIQFAFNLNEWQVVGNAYATKDIHLYNRVSISIHYICIENIPNQLRC